MAEKREEPELPVLSEDPHPTEPAEGAREPGEDAEAARPPHAEEPVEGAR